MIAELQQQAGKLGELICSSWARAGLGGARAASSSWWVHATATSCGRRQLTWASRDLNNGSTDFGRIKHSPGSLPVVIKRRGITLRNGTLTTSWRRPRQAVAVARDHALLQRTLLSARAEAWRAVPLARHRGQHQRTRAAWQIMPAAPHRQRCLGRTASCTPGALRPAQPHPPPVYSTAAAAPSGPRGGTRTAAAAPVRASATRRFQALMPTKKHGGAGEDKLGIPPPHATDQTPTPSCRRDARGGGAAVAGTQPGGGTRTAGCKNGRAKYTGTDPTPHPPPLRSSPPHARATAGGRRGAHHSGAPYRAGALPGGAGHGGRA